MDPASPLTSDLLAAAEQTVRRFIEAALHPLTTHPEIAVTSEQSRTVTAAAHEAGLLGPGDGLGLWSRLDDPMAVRLSLATLANLAQTRTGMAHHLHQLALGAALCRRLGLNAERAVLPALATATAHASRAHAELLAGRPPSSGSAAVLCDDLPPLAAGGELLVHTAEPWAALLLPHLDTTEPLARVRWSCIGRDSLNVEPEFAAHGLDDAPAIRLSLRQTDQAEFSPVDAPTAARTLRQAVGLQALASVALALGALRRALGMARQYARDRVQGGGPIVEHAAVQELLGEAAAVEVMSTAALGGVSAAAADADALATQLGLRAALQPRLSDGINAALQVFGGSGYMRDLGIEACLRDANHLRVVGGSPAVLQRLTTMLAEVAP